MFITLVFLFAAVDEQNQQTKINISIEKAPHVIPGEPSSVLGLANTHDHPVFTISNVDDDAKSCGDDRILSGRYFVSLIQGPAEKPTTFGTPKNKPKISQIKTFIAKTQRHKIAI